MVRITATLIFLLVFTMANGQTFQLSSAVDSHAPIVLGFTQINFEGQWKVSVDQCGYVWYINLTDVSAKVEILRSDGLNGWIEVPKGGRVLIIGNVAHFWSVSDFFLPLRKPDEKW